MTNNKLSDSDDLAKKLQKGQLEVMALLIEKYQDQAYGLAYQITKRHSDADDITQEAFVIVLEKISQWQGQNFRSWLLRIVRNLAIDFLRKRNKESSEKLLEPKVNFFDQVVTAEEKMQVHQVLQSLPAAQKEILYLRFFENMSLQEIAQKRNCSVGTVKATLFQTFQKLKRDFRQHQVME